MFFIRDEKPRRVRKTEQINTIHQALRSQDAGRDLRVRSLSSFFWEGGGVYIHDVLISGYIGSTLVRVFIVMACNNATLTIFMMYKYMAMGNARRC